MISYAMCDCAVKYFCMYATLQFAYLCNLYSLYTLSLYTVWLWRRHHVPLKQHISLLHTA